MTRRETVLEQVFHARLALRSLADEPAPKAANGNRPKAMPVDMRDLVAFARDPQSGALPSHWRDGLAQAPVVRDSLRRLFAKAATQHFPRAAAAATPGLLTEREANGWRLRLLPSRAESAQVFLLIDMAPHVTQAPCRLVASAEGALVVQPLPAPINGVIQLLLEAESELVALLGRTDTEVMVS